MNPIRIPVTLSPHTVKLKPRGYYLIAQRLFKNGNPQLVRKQFLGITNEGAIITVGRNNHYNTLMEMALHVPFIKIYEKEQFNVTWLSGIKIYPINMGFRAYIPGKILKPTSAGSKKIETTGIFRRFHTGTIDLYYLEVPKISGGVLMGKEDLK